MLNKENNKSRFRKEENVNAYRFNIKFTILFTKICMAAILVTLIFCRVTMAENLILSDVQDIFDLDMAKVNIQQFQGFNYMQGADRQQLFNLQGIHTKTVSCNINVGDCELSRQADGNDLITIKDLPDMSNLGQPQVPMKTVTVKLAKDAEILGIEVVNGSYQQILDSINIATKPQPRVWMKPEDIPEQFYKKFESLLHESPVQQMDTYFPGNIATYDTGKDNDSACVNIRFSPIQYIPRTNEAVVITNAEINLYYRLPASQVKALSNNYPTDLTECVIICPSEIRTAAELLRDFHVEEENLSTSVITTEDIDAAYLPTSDPPFMGYAGDHAGKDNIAGYDYELARKIISYLRDHEKHPNLKYVTLFGDGQLIPPSYYINEWLIYEWYSGAYYEDWIPTDFLYTSPDYDFVPNYKVGRLYPYPLSRQKTGVSKVDSSPCIKAVGTEGARRATRVPTATLYTSAGVL